MKAFSVHLKAGGAPLKYQALSYETIDGKIYFFKDDERKDRSLFVDESVVSAITEEQSSIPPLIAELRWNNPIVLGIGIFIVLEILGSLLISLNTLDHLLMLAIAGSVYLVLSKPEVREISLRKVWEKIGFTHPVVWGLIGYTAFGILTLFSKEFLVVTGIIKIGQLLFVVLAIGILLLRLLKNKDRRGSLLGKILIGAGTLCFVILAFPIYQVYSDYLSYEARTATIKNIGYWEKSLTKTNDGYVAFTSDDYEMAQEYAREYGGDKGPCVYQFRGGSFYTEPAELTPSEKLGGFVWKAKGIFKFDGMRKLNVFRQEWRNWSDYRYNGILFEVSILCDKNGKWMIIYNQELKKMVVDLSKLPSLD